MRRRRFWRWFCALHRVFSPNMLEEMGPVFTGAGPLASHVVLFAWHSTGTCWQLDCTCNLDDRLRLAPLMYRSCSVSAIRRSTRNWHAFPWIRLAPYSENTVSVVLVDTGSHVMHNAPSPVILGNAQAIFGRAYELLLMECHVWMLSWHLVAKVRRRLRSVFDHIQQAETYKTQRIFCHNSVNASWLWHAQCLLF